MIYESEVGLKYVPVEYMGLVFLPFAVNWAIGKVKNKNRNHIPRL